MPASASARCPCSTASPASAFVTAAEPCELLSVSEERVFSDLLPQPGFARGLLRMMSGRLRATLDRQATWESLRKELRLAREIQASMLPPTGLLFLDHPEIDCAAAMDAAAEVGGDFYDAFFLDERRLFFAVGDVAGKGIAAAVFMARSLALLRAEALRRRPLHELLGRVNEVLALGNEQATFVALTCCVLDTTSGILRVANGGGGAPFLRDERGWQRMPMPRGIVVGAIPGVRLRNGAHPACARRSAAALQRRRHRGAQPGGRAVRHRAPADGARGTRTEPTPPRWSRACARRWPSSPEPARRPTI